MGRRDDAGTQRAEPQIILSLLPLIRRIPLIWRCSVFLFQGSHNEKKWNDLYKKWYTSGLAFNKLDSINGKKNEIFQRWLKHPSYDAYWQSMTPDPKEYSKINIPILTTTGYFDDDQLGAMYYYNPKKVDIKKQSWIKKLQVALKIKNHIFLKDK